MKKRRKSLKSSFRKKVIAVVAGSGDLPTRIIAKLEELKSSFVVVSISGFGSEAYPQFALGEIGGMLDYVKTRGVTDIVFCGAVKRPSMFSLKLDSVGKKWLKKLGIRAFLGDDALLKRIRELLKEEGLNVLKPQDILNALLTPSGILTKMKPSERDIRDIARGMFVLNTMAKADIGQALVVQEGIVLAVEAAEGTAEMIQRTKALKLKTEQGGVLVKLAKTNQDEAMDLPTIGTKTIIEAKEANLAGIALGARNTQIIDYNETVELADEHGIFIIGI